MLNLKKKYTMKCNLFILIVFIASTFFIGSCSKHVNEPDSVQPGKVNPTTQQLHVRDSVIAQLSKEKPAESKLKAGLAVTVAATQLTCNTFRLTVTVNQQICPSTPN